jgi:hypothetical protein
MKRIMRLHEFVSTEPAVKPTTAPPQTAPPVTRPGRPIPTKRPSEKEQGKPMASVKDVLDMFFTELEEVKDTNFGKSIIKKLHNKYAKNK